MPYMESADRPPVTLPDEDEEISEEEGHAVVRSKEWFKHNQGTPFEQVVVECGLTMDQIRNRKELAD